MDKITKKIDKLNIILNRWFFEMHECMIWIAKMMTQYVACMLHSGFVIPEHKCTKCISKIENPLYCLSEKCFGESNVFETFPWEF